MTLYEAGSRVGGVIQTLRQDGYLAEFGPNSILETSPKITSLIADLGLERRRLYSDPRASNRFIVRGGKPVLLPDSPFGFVSTRLFSAGAKLRLLSEPFIRRAPAASEENLAEFVKRRIGQEFLDYAINPLVGGVYAGDPARLSVKHAFPKLHALEQKYGSLLLGQFLGARERKRRAEVSKQNAKKLSFDEGLQVLIDALRMRVGNAVQLNSPVIGVEQTPEEAGPSRRALTAGKEQTHSAVLFAGQAHKLADISLVSGLR